MKVSATSKLVRWAYWYCERPRQTTLCVLFWRSVLLSPLTGIGCVIASPILIPVWLWCKYLSKPYDAWVKRREQAKYDRATARWKARQVRNMERALKPPSSLKLLWMGLVSLKKKACPIITFDED